MEIARLGRLIAAGKLEVSDLVGSGSRGIFAFRRILKSELIKSMQAASDFGAQQVRNEIQRQGVKAR